MESWNALFGALTTVLAICGIPTYFGWKMLKKIQTEVAKMSYVPPATLNTLPPDEILVRCTEEPHSVQSEVLLRMAALAPDVAREEMLRAGHVEQV